MKGAKRPIPLRRKIAPREKRPSFVWDLAAIVVGTALFLAAQRTDFYNLTSPPDFRLHVVLRKVYSIGAFALVVYLIARALAQRGRKLSTGNAVAIGATYSAAIEIAQYVGGSPEGLYWNAFDIACGALGGFIAAWAIGLQTRERPTKKRSLRR